MPFIRENSKSKIVNRNSSINHSLLTIYRKTFGFTLIELIVVISIIGILVTIGTATYTTAQQKSRDVRRKQDLAAVKGIGPKTVDKILAALGMGETS